MSVFLQKGGDFMTTLIKTPFKKKRQTIAGGDEAKSASQTPRSARGSSTARTNSLASSSVNSCCCDDEDNAYVVPNNSNNKNNNNNIYVDIDDGDDNDDGGSNSSTNALVVPPELPQANYIPLKVSTINECDMLFEQCGEINCSKNNLLLIDEHVMTSIDDHLNNIELINKNLDKLMATQDLIEHEALDETVPVEIRAEKKKLKEKIAEKIKMLKEARNVNGGSGAVAKGSFTSRFKNILRQSSQDEATPSGSSGEGDEKKIKKKFLSSFRKKSPSVDESDEIFEEIAKDNQQQQQQVTDLDENSVEKSVKKKFKQKFMRNLLTVKIGKKSQKVEYKVCRRCSKQYNVNEEGQRIHHSPAISDLTKEFPLDEDLCSCLHESLDDEFDDDGIVIKNFEYKDVSV